LEPPQPPVSNRVFEWVHTQVARFDEPLENSNELGKRKDQRRLPSLDYSMTSASELYNSINLVQPRSNSLVTNDKWASSSSTTRQPLLPPIVTNVVQHSVDSTNAVVKSAFYSPPLSTANSWSNISSPSPSQKPHKSNKSFK
ncbi:unnamed protein product, partial [Didymodactylos carnosus]